MSSRPSQPVVFQPEAHLRFQCGVAKLVGALQPTLGPRPRLVAIDTGIRGKLPELLDNGALIARRMIELPDRDEDMGAMFVRGMLWRLHERVGDGTTTAAILFRAIYDGGLRYLAAGGNAVGLRYWLEQGMELLLEELSAMTTQIEGQVQLTRLAESLCDDPPLAALLGEIFDIIGEHGRLDIRSARGRELEREYIEGSFWESGVLSPYMLPNQVPLRVELEQAAILLSDLEITDPHQLVPLLELALQNEIRALVIVAKKLSHAAISLLLANRQPGTLEAIAVKTPGGLQDEQAAALADLAAATGGRPFLSAAGASLATVQVADLGRARRAWADRSFLGIIAGGGNPRAYREYIRMLRTAFSAAQEVAGRDTLRQRIGRLLGGSATLWIGGDSDAHIAARRERAEQTAMALRSAVLEGVVPGGGAALLACRPALRRAYTASNDLDQRAAYSILLNALEAPIRAIIQNTGYETAPIMAEIERLESGHGFDARTEQVACMAEAGIFDAAYITRTVLQTAVSSAALALTVDAHIHTRRTDAAWSPEG